ncbi:MAG: cell division protein FtsI (penicillin-binding protein 3), partial [Salibacteraceae bacterium]
GLSLPWISHGYELQLTPLQILTFYNAVANDGTMMKPMFAKLITNYGDIVKEYQPVVLKKSIASKETIRKARIMLEAVVTEGTAKNLQNASFSIAGKTGTAQISQGSSGYKGRKSYQASFCGYFPADKPLYSCIVVVNAPSKNVYYGNLVAGPIFKEIANKVYSTSLNAQDELLAQVRTGNRPMVPISKNGDYDDLSYVYKELNVPFTRRENARWVSVSTGKDSVAVSAKRHMDNLMPNVVGMDVEDAIYLLENKGVKVEIQGRGVVKFQSVSPGFQIPDRGYKIKLSLA